MSSKDIDATYQAFIENVNRYYYLGDSIKVLDWDQRVTMPEAGNQARSKQRSTLKTIQHEHLTSGEIAEQLAALDGDLATDRQAILREIKREHDRANSVPDALIERISEAQTDALPKWESAKENDDFSEFEPALAKHIELQREFAASIDPDRDPYEVLVEEYEPYLDIETIEGVLETLRNDLPDLIDEIADSDVELTSPFVDSYPEADQESLLQEILDLLGYDRSRGRLDTSAHPFSIGTQFDARVTTRIDPEDPLGAIGSTIHEFGHASYTLGLPDEAYGTPLGDHRDMTVHESQSRLWENHIGRSKPFWQLLADPVQEYLGVNATPTEFYEAANRVYDDNLIRVEADELTYHAHILLRFEIERDLIRGNLEASDVPSVWNDKMEEYLGIRPETDAEGCLQDIHWANGAFGYFPTYSLGSMLAAQLFATLEDDLSPETESLDSDIEAGEVTHISEWLTEHIHSHGCRYTTDALIEEVTGEPLTAKYFLSYAEEKYGQLYDL